MYWAPYVPVAVRQKRAAAKMAKRAKQGHAVSPVEITGRTIATTAWGKAWCTNLEAYSDFSNRLPRGRTYVRNGSVVDLQITAGRIEAHVSGSSLYRCVITVNTVPKAQWKAMCADCAGGIDSLVELLQGRLADGVMHRLCRQGDGLFPTPRQLSFDCDCPDWASMCKHVAAALYGIGNRLDHQPDLLFTLRGVDPADLISQAGAGISVGVADADARILAGDDLGDLFGLEIDAGEASDAKPAKSAGRRGRKPKLTVAKRGARKVRKATPVASTPPPRGRTLYARLYKVLDKQGSLTNAQAQAALDQDADTLRPLLQRLVADGHATITGRTRGTTYHRVS